MSWMARSLMRYANCRPSAFDTYRAIGARLRGRPHCIRPRRHLQRFHPLRADDTPERGLYRLLQRYDQIQLNGSNTCRPLTKEFAFSMISQSVKLCTRKRRSQQPANPPKPMAPYMEHTTPHSKRICRLHPKICCKTKLQEARRR